MIELYADGSCPRLGGPGGWAFVCVSARIIRHEQAGSVPEATNNTMELTAVLRALEWAAENVRGELKVISDSQYVILGMNGRARKWKSNGWHLQDKHNKWVPVKNVELWRSLYRIALSRSAKVKATYEWVRGHNGNEYNELCDKLAGEQAWSRIDA